MYRICKGCGWEFPSCYTLSKCKFCKTEFEVQVCSKCQEPIPKEQLKIDGRGNYILVCRKCNNQTVKEFRQQHVNHNKECTARHDAKRRRFAEEYLATWTEASNISLIPLSERAWLEACEYFGGCAICGEEHVEVREFFVPFQAGGKYAAWNIIPMCSKCIKYSRSQLNPFLWMDSRLGSARDLGLNEERKQKLLDYLKLQVERCKNNG